MPYFNDNILGDERKQPNYFNRRVAAKNGRNRVTFPFLVTLKSRDFY